MFDKIENTINGFLDDTNITPKGITAASLADATVTGAKIAAATVTSSNTADGVGQVASGTVVGDGTTSRVVSVGFTPRWVQIIRTDATFVEYVAMAVGAATYFWYRDNTGAQAASTVNWQGVVAGGFKFGTGPGTSNVLGVTYAWAAWK